MDAATDNAHVTRLELRFRPIGLRAANDFVAAHHRHHGPTRGHKFSISVTDAQGQIRGVAIAGRPVARRLDDGAHLEVLRVCTDGTPNVCSMLYGAVRRAAKLGPTLPIARRFPPDGEEAPLACHLKDGDLTPSTTDRMPNVGLSPGPQIR